MSSRPSVAAVYPSAIDWWVAAILLAAPIISLVVGVALLVQQRYDDASAVFLTGAIAVAVTAAFTLPCRYTLLDDTLNVRCGILFTSIPYETIERVERSSSWLSGPALSLRRVRVVTSRRSYLLSPRDLAGFLDDLDRRMNGPVAS